MGSEASAGAATTSNVIIAAAHQAFLQRGTEAPTTKAEAVIKNARCCRQRRAAHNEPSHRHVDKSRARWSDYFYFNVKPAENPCLD